jgi:cytochrome b
MTAGESSAIGTGCERQPVRPAELQVWDPLVRGFHWALVLFFAIAWATGDELDRLHEFAGYVVLGLVVFRVVWGIVGTKHARFADFVRPSSVVRAYLGDSLRFRAKRYLGHNPAGGAMIVLMLVMLSIVSATGVMLTLDAFFGSAWVEALHEGAVNLMLVMIVMHLAGVVFSSIAHGENLVRAMLTGRKRAS